jgi:hypothetical protein
MTGRLWWLALLVVANGCGKKGDARRAADERAAARKAGDESLLLVPYRGVKITARSSGAQRVPEALRPLELLFQSRVDPVEVVLALYQGRAALAGLDEDRFPTLWEAANPGKELPLPGYDAGMEHLGLALGLLVMDRQNAAPTAPLVLYELDRAHPAAAWPSTLRPLARLGRGLAYASSQRHYAAEEELNAYLAELPPPGGPYVTVSQHENAEQSRQKLLAIGHLSRGWNRHALGRDDAAMDDLEKGLEALQRGGLENELTWWGWTIVHQHRGRYADAASSLGKLAASDYLDARTRTELQAAAAGLAREGKSPGFLAQERTMLLVYEALLARAGGVDGLVLRAVGEENGRPFLERLHRLHEIRRQLTAPVAGGREAGGKLLEALKKKVGLR